jgi:hypothetical protein
MRICFTGSRHWRDYETVRETLVKLQRKWGDGLEIAHGKSPGGGADLLVETAAAALGIKQWPFPIRGGTTGVDGPNPRVAPLRRNRRMLNSFLPDRVIAFRATGRSNGTDHTVELARSMGIPVETIHEERT